MVEARPRVVVVAAHVPLADRGVVARLLQLLGKENGPLRHTGVVIDDAMLCA